MKTSKELKVISKEGLKGKRGQAMGVMLLNALVSCVPFCSPAMTVGYCKYNLKLVRKEETQVGNVFEGFSVFGKALWLSILIGFFVYLWSLLLIIPGIVKSFAYAMSNYILAENPGMTAREALRASKKMMDGKKGKLFWLMLTFIWWYLLGMITLGIAYLWIVPYMQATFAAFYEEAKEK